MVLARLEEERRRRADARRCGRGHGRELSPLLEPALLPAEEPHELADVDAAMALIERAARENRIVVVDFYADWCGPCQAIKPVFERMALETPRALFAKVNTDKAKQLAGVAGVRSLPTFQLRSSVHVRLRAVRV